ncbi:tudor domain-containing protein 5-like [Saccostrea echinata]|uniref:tudor domain-containing protein 5-like n=1 Tax=Saccostrea echinata TaxID=191078 RepID=UPI002A82C262|nr:tudor domain-containing protein 5-like [Saccostrea echinata]
MSSKAQKKEDVKKNLRSLLLSAPAALTIDELKRDYHDFIMEPIPYRALGYVNLEDLLKDMSDALHITWKKGVMCVAGIADSNTAHIQKLVSRQKVSNKNKWATLRKGGPPPQRHRSQQPRPLPTVPPFIRNYLSQLFKAYPDGLPFTHFDAAFSKRFNIQIDPIRLGFSSLKELLKTVPDILEVKELQNGEVRVSPASSGAYKQSQQPREHPFHKSYQQNLPPRLERQRSAENKTNTQATNSYTNSPFSTGATNQWENGQTKTPAQSAGRGKKKSCINKENNGPGTWRRRYESEESSGTYSSSDQSVDFESTISHQLHFELQQLLSSKPEGLWATKLLTAYKETFNKELKPMDHGYTSVIELCSALPQVIRMERPHCKGDWKLFDKRLPSPKPDKSASEEASVRKRHGSELCADSTLKETIRQVLQAHPEGIRLQDLTEVFQDETGRCLEWEKLGFTRVEAFALSLADSVLKFEYRGNNSIYLYAVDDQSPPRTDLLLPKGARNQPPAILTSVAPEVHVPLDSNVPSDAIGPGCSYTQIDLPSCNTWIEIYVSNVASPGQFWFQLRGPKTSLALEKLMNQLEESYSGEAGMMYLIPSEMVAVGLIVAAVFPEDDNWHRCVITGMCPGNYVEVYFVDYGNTCDVHRNNIRFLRSKFLKLPAQGILGRLSNIQPVGEEWSVESQSCMLRLVSCRPLVAIATSEKNRVMSLCCSDTSGKEDIHINDVLIQQGHACFVIDNPDLVYSEDPKVIADFPFSSESETASTFSDSTFFENLAAQSSSEIQSIHYVLQLQLTSEVVVHLINLDGVAYLLSSDVSSFFWEDDVLTSMLFQKKAHVNKTKVTVEEYPALFCELYHYGVKSVKQKVLTLYELNGVPGILKLFRCESEELEQNVSQLIESFDPEDPYWKGEDFEAGDSDVEQLSTDQIEETLQILQFRRKRVLQSMLNNTENTEEIVNNLNDVEMKIKSFESLLKNKQGAVSRETEASIRGTESKGVDPRQFEDVTKEERKSLPVSPQKIVFGTDTSFKPVATVASMPQPKPQVSESSVATENPSISQLNTASLLQQINQQQQQLNMFQTLLLNQYAQSAASFPLGTDPSQQVPSTSAVGAAGAAPGNILGLGRGMPPMNTRWGNLLLPGLMPLLESLNLEQDWTSSQTHPGMGRGVPNIPKQNPSGE